MNVRRYDLVMAIFPNTRGAAYAVFEAPFSPIDWGVFEARGKAKNRQCVRRSSQLLGRYQPAVLVLQDMSAHGTQRARRVRLLNEAIALLAETRGVEVVTFSREDVRACFAAEGLATKQRIAEAVAKHIPMFAQFIPPPRKPWHTEHPRMGLFDAASLVLAFFQSRGPMADQTGRGDAPGATMAP